VILKEFYFGERRSAYFDDYARRYTDLPMLVLLREQVTAAGETVLVKYHWIPRQGVRSWTAADAAAVQAEDLGPHSKDLYEAIEAGEYPEWELLVQMMSDDEHPELDFDPLDDTKVWPEDLFPPKPVGRMQLNRNVENVFAENEQIAFGTGV